MLRILFLSLNVALLQGNPVAKEKDRCGYEITTTQNFDVTTVPDVFECPLPEYFDPLSKWKMYSLINRRQLHILSIKPKLDMRLFVDFCVFPRFSLDLPELNLKLFSSAVQNNFRFSSGKFRVRH